MNPLRAIWSPKRRNRSHARRRPPCGRHLRLEPLEERALLAVISGTTFDDLDGDGVQQMGEPGLEDWTIYLDLNDNGQLDIGGATEGFETGDFSAFPWVTLGDADWVVTSSVSNSGTFSAQAGAIADSEISILEITLDTVEGNIEFSRLVSSEAGYDFLQFLFF